MANKRLIWDAVGERLYETGVDHGVLYVMGDNNTYGEGIAWNGLTAVNESPSGAESTALYADNIKYLNLISAEEYGYTIEAYYSPEEFDQCDGLASPVAGLTIGQQKRKMFGFVYRSLIGNDTDGQDHGYKLHLCYGCQASPSERNHQTVNDSPEATTLSWTVSTTPANVTGVGAEVMTDFHRLARLIAVPIRPSWPTTGHSATGALPLQMLRIREPTQAPEWQRRSTF